MKVWEPRDNFQHIAVPDFWGIKEFKKKKVKPQISVTAWISDFTQIPENHQKFHLWNFHLLHNRHQLTNALFVLQTKELKKTSIHANSFYGLKARMVSYLILHNMHF